VVRSVLEDSSSTTRAHSSPLRPISVVETLYRLPSAGRGNGAIGSGAGGGPGGHRSAAEDSSGVDELPGLFPSFGVGGSASGASSAPGAAVTATATSGPGVYALRYTYAIKG